MNIRNDDIEKIPAIVDEYSNIGKSITRYLQKNEDGGFIELQFISDNNFNIIEQKNTLNEKQAQQWINKFAPNLKECTLIAPPKNVDLLAGYSKHSLYQHKDGRFFKFTEKMNDWNYSILETIIWLKPGKEKNWKKKH